MKILVLDNYDSFTFNLVHIVEKASGRLPAVFKNDEISLNEVEAFDAIILSPGPGLPNEAGILLSLIKKYAATKPILGVCLGHQAIGEVFCGKLVNLPMVFHGVSTKIFQSGIKTALFNDLPQEFYAGRYHSWVVEAGTLPPTLEVTATDEHGSIMAMQHTSLNIQSVQFHPESILTPTGETIINNWLTNFIS